MKRFLLLFLLFLVFGYNVQAQDLRVVEMEWDPVPGAISYQVELFRLVEGDKQSEGIRDLQYPRWSEKLQSGNYEFRIRSLDYRKVPGAWSDTIPFNVDLPTPIVVTPQEGETIYSRFSDQDEVEFKWRPVRGASSYFLEVWNDKNEVLYSDSLNDLKKVLRLSSNNKYFWRVEALKEGGDPPPRLQGKPFYIETENNNAPEIKIKRYKNYLILSWTAPDGSNRYDYSFFGKTKKGWSKYTAKNDYEKDRLIIKRTLLKPGHYRLQVRAKENSTPLGESQVEFLWDGNSDQVTKREVIAQTEGTYEESIRAKAPNYTLWGNLDFPSFNYSGVAKETDTTAQNNYAGQQYSFGLNFNLSNPRLSWLNGVEQGTYNNLQQQFTLWEFRSALNYEWMSSWGGFNTRGGLFAKKLPFLIADRFDGKISTSGISSLGILLGGDIIYYLAPKWSLNAGLNLYSHLFGLSTPNSKAIAPTISQTIDLKGIYYYDDFIQLKLGLTLFNFTNSYKATTNDEDGLSLALGEDTNTVEISGYTLSLGAGMKF